MIMKKGGRWHLYSHDGKKHLGSFTSRRQAKLREMEINYFKHKNE